MQGCQSLNGLIPGNNKNQYAIGVDIGGTTLRCGLVSRRGRIRRGSLHRVRIDSKGKRESILTAFTEPMRSNIAQARREGLSLAGIGIGMCGPLDYEAGICLMRGVDKYEDLFGVNLKTEFRTRLGLPDDFPIKFEVDAWSFARGEAWLGAARGSHRLLAVTLGTGLGSAFLANGQICTDGPGVPPPFGWVGQLPYNDGKLDDVISRRGILKLYYTLMNSSSGISIDVKDIADMAKCGDSAAVQTFSQFGNLLGKALKPSLKQFRADCLMCGGRISLSFPLFEKPMRSQLKEIKGLKTITPAQSIDLATLRGSARQILFPNQK